MNNTTIEKKAGILRKYIEKEVWVKLDSSTTGHPFQKITILEVRGKNIRHETDWIHFSEIQSIHSSDPNGQ